MSEGQEQQSDLSVQERQLRGYVKCMMETTVRGIISVNAHERPDRMLMMCVIGMAMAVAELYIGEEVAVKKYRKFATNAFEEMLKTSPVLDKAGYEQTTETADIRGMNGHRAG